MPGEREREEERKRRGRWDEDVYTVCSMSLALEVSLSCVSVKLLKRSTTHSPMCCNGKMECVLSVCL